MKMAWPLLKILVANHFMKMATFAINGQSWQHWFTETLRGSVFQRKPSKRAGTQSCHVTHKISVFDVVVLVFETEVK